jgi:hypothetical protein
MHAVCGTYRHHHDWQAATLNEFRLGSLTIASGESQAGAAAFASGKGRHGASTA